MRVKNVHYEAMVAALHSLVDSGQVKGGATVYLETLPIRFLRAVPLVEGKWIDRYVIEMTEWGALLQTKGYVIQFDEKDHPLAHSQFIGNDGTEADQDEVIKLRKQVASNLAKFPGRITKVDGHHYIQLEDYCRW